MTPFFLATNQLRHGQTVRHTDDDVADGVACGEVLLNVWRHWHGLQQSALTYVLPQAEKTPERELGGAIDRRAFLRNLRGQRPDVTTGGRSPALTSICSDVTPFPFLSRSVEVSSGLRNPGDPLER
jgi:hypothetical protein